VYEKKIEDPQEVTKDELELPTHEKMHIWAYAKTK
jgi:hypothetical protein